ncbi:hypothetical protein [Labedaea rhizosphaerae]|uniref:MFS transporter n=1 Tax=Labedaea rhizosphaerae TaxID=598644 RepID=A0A4R6RUB5_LABRH|nr:hypothetical protein [Labedaea rhizosphaerae]TDP90531.1 hypothetical protein EV186_11071 [Labedaea rhizosphaerae]
MNPARLLLLAVTCGVAVGNVYFPQGITPLIPDATGVVPATQFGYACGIFLLVPLGDRARPRTLIVTLLALTAAGLVLAAVAWTWSVLVIASWSVGVTTVVAPIIGPLAAGRCRPPGRVR